MATLALYFQEPREPTVEELALIDSSSHLAGIAIERKRADQALRDSEQFHRVITESAHEAILTIDESSRVVFANPATERIFGHPVEAIVGESVTMLIPEPLRVRHTSALQQLVQSEDPTRRDSIEVAGLRKDGQVISVELSFGRHIRDGKLFFTGILRDTSERQRVQQELNKREAELAHVGRLCMLGEAVAEIAHEINQPLYAISNFAKASYIGLEKRSLQPDELVARFKRIDGLATSAGETLNRIRRFLQRHDPDPTVVSVNEVTVESIRIIEFEAKRKRIDIEVNPLPDDTSVWADRVQIQQVLVNLLKNAFDSMEDTPLEMRAVHIGACRKNDLVEISVRDQGSGFLDIIPETVFDAFRSTKSEGLGMGLVITRSIIEAHGGELWFTENAESGVTFHVTLPITTMALHQGEQAC